MQCSFTFYTLFCLQTTRRLAAHMLKYIIALRYKQNLMNTNELQYNTNELQWQTCCERFLANLASRQLKR